MAPRKYEMAGRAKAMAETRTRILDAAKELHASNGVRVTSWDEIADGAGVAVATVYRHFPTLDELVPACARSVFDFIRPPTLEEASSRFAALSDPSDRLALLVKKSVHCYELGEGWLHAAYRERDFLRSLDNALAIIQGAVDVLVTAAVARRLGKTEHALLFTLCDFPFYKLLVDSGLDRRVAERRIIDLVTTVEKESRP